MYLVLWSEFVWMSNPNGIKSQGFLPKDQRLQTFEMWNSVYWWLRICKLFQIYCVWYKAMAGRKWSFAFKIIQLKPQNRYKMLSSFSDNFMFNIADFKILQSAIIRVSLPKLPKFGTCRSLRRKVWFFSVPLDLKFKAILITESQKSSSTLSGLWNADWEKSDTWASNSINLKI